MKAMKISAVLLILACGVQVTDAQTKHTVDFDHLMNLSQGTETLNNAAYEKPCALQDDDNWYTAYNEKLGVEGDPQLANSLLRTCQEQLKDKLAGKVQQITTTYFDQMDLDGNSKAAEHIEGASQMIVDQMINETREYCRKERPSIYEEGKIILYMGIRVKKNDIVNEVVEGIQNDAEAKTRFNEQKFREAAFKVFNEDNQQ